MTNRPLSESMAMRVNKDSLSSSMNESDNATAESDKVTAESDNASVV